MGWVPGCLSRKLYLVIFLAELVLTSRTSTLYTELTVNFSTYHVILCYTTLYVRLRPVKIEIIHFTIQEKPPYLNKKVP
jgi:hypothetical protein